jgi:hypothetical protein
VDGWVVYAKQEQMKTNLEPQQQPAQSAQESSYGLMSLICLVLQLVSIILLFLSTMVFGFDWLRGGFFLISAPAFFIILSAIAIITGGIDLHLRTQKIPVSAVLTLITIVLAMAILVITLNVEGCGTWLGCRQTSILLLLALAIWIGSIIALIMDIVSTRKMKTTIALIGIGLAPIIPCIMTAVLIFLLTGIY